MEDRIKELAELLGFEEHVSLNGDERCYAHKNDPAFTLPLSWNPWKNSGDLLLILESLIEQPFIFNEVMKPIIDSHREELKPQLGSYLGDAAMFMSGVNAVLKGQAMIAEAALEVFQKQAKANWICNECGWYGDEPLIATHSSGGEVVDIEDIMCPKCAASDEPFFSGTEKQRGEWWDAWWNKDN